MLLTSSHLVNNKIPMRSVIYVLSLSNIKSVNRLCKVRSANSHLQWTTRSLLSNNYSLRINNWKGPQLANLELQHPQMPSPKKKIKIKSKSLKVTFNKSIRKNKLLKKVWKKPIEVWSRARSRVKIWKSNTYSSSKTLKGDCAWLRTNSVKFLRCTLKRNTSCKNWESMRQSSPKNWKFNLLIIKTTSSCTWSSGKSIRT